MITRSLKTAALCGTTALLLAAGTAQATGNVFQSTGNGDWSSYLVWQRYDSQDGKFHDLISTDAVPGVGDTAAILGSDAITVNAANEGITTLTVDAAASLTVSNGYVLTIGGASPSAVFAGAFNVNGRVDLTSSSGAAPYPYIEFLGSQTCPAASGEIRGLNSATRQPAIYVDANASANTLTNAGVMSGYIRIMGSNNGSNAATFANHNIVTANVNREFALDASLTSISDGNAAYLWKVESNSSARLTFDIGSASLSGTFQLLVGSGRLNVNASVSTPAMVIDHGDISVANGATFTFGTPTGTCTSKPSSPLSGPTLFTGCP